MPEKAGIFKNYGIPLGFAALSLIGSIFLPWWGMRFDAPQYPEGLDIIVYPYKLDGRTDIINNLNQYIGMKALDASTFPELQYLPYIITGFAVLCLLGIWLRKKSYIYGLISILFIGGGLGIYDISRRLREFGTELDPHAPIKVKPFAPPILGDNRIANFVTHSYFSYGSLLLGIAFLLILTVLWRERSR